MGAAIYLDTQHISRAASGKNRLLEFLDNPGLCFCYSAIHIIESLPKAPVENAGSIERLSIIMRRSSKGLVGWGRLAELEKSSRQLKLSDILCEIDDILFPNVSFSRTQWMKRVREGLKEVLRQQITDENLRRSIQSKLLKGGKLTPAAFQFIRSEIPKTKVRVSSEISQAVPMLEKGGLYDFLEAKTSEQAFTRMFKETLANPVALASMATHPDLVSIIDLSKILWTQMDELRELLSKFVIRLAESQRGVGTGAYATIRAIAFDKLGSPEFRTAVAHRFSGTNFGSELLDRMCGIRLLVDVFSQYVLVSD